VPPVEKDMTQTTAEPGSQPIRSPTAGNIRLSIIIEWENALLAEASRAVEMLRQLDRQTRETGVSAEVLILYDREEVDESVIHGCLDAAEVSSGFRTMASVHAVEGLSYYHLKNAGAERSVGELILFVDSDVIPEAGWLGRLLSHFDRDDVQVVGSTPYVDSSNVYEKTFALTWFFPLRSDDGPIAPADTFFANSVIFRREVFMAFPFPEPDGRARGHCVSLSRTLRDNGITIWRDPSARVSHPPPNGVKHFLVRGLYNGHDHYLDVACRAPGRVGRVAGVGHFVDQTARGLRRVLRYRSKVGMPLVGVPIALGITGLYGLMGAVGYAATAVRPQFVENNFDLG
jgi:hypothetical protein